MNRTEFIGKLNALYVGDNNCLEELLTAYDEKDREIERLNKELQEFKDGRIEIDELVKMLNQELFSQNERLNNIINGLEEYIKIKLSTTTMHIYTINAFEEILNKLQKLKGVNKE